METRLFNMADKIIKQCVSISEYKCAICLRLLIEPVFLPCHHEICLNCFRKCVEIANFLCPICRKRIASWARKRMREGTLVDQNRWNCIQKLFPELCSKRLNGDDDSDDELWREPSPKRVLANCGEVRQEYEEEMKKIQQGKETEEQASKDLIRQILEQEQNQKLLQEREDEIFARKLSTDLPIEKTKQESNHKDLKGTKRSTHRRIKSGQNFSLMNNDENGSSSTTETKNCNGKECNDDYEFALKLQKQLDKEAIALSKRDEYRLRSAKYHEHQETSRNKITLNKGKISDTCKEKRLQINTNARRKNQT